MSRRNASAAYVTCGALKQIKAREVHSLMNLLFTCGGPVCLNWHEIEVRSFQRDCFLLHFSLDLLSIWHLALPPSS